tara:strand:- start:30 stop:620 length:591 start_codon:yes stop_codon:yes gene_type:complete
MAKKPFILKKKVHPRQALSSKGYSLPQLRALGGSVNEEVAKIIAKSVILYLKTEAANAVAKGAPSFLQSEEFRNALGYEIEKDSRGLSFFRVTLKHNKRWEFLNAYLNASQVPSPYKMRWLTRSERKEKLKIPIKDKKTGKLVYRSIPLTTDKAWVHPGIKRFNWIDRGVKKGINRAMPEVMRYLTAEINKKALGQ